MLEINLKIFMKDSCAEQLCKDTGIPEDQLDKHIKEKLPFVSKFLFPGITSLNNNPDVIFESSVEKDGIPYLYIDIEGYPHRKVIGGLQVEKRKSREKETLVMIDAYGIKPLFKIVGSKAIFAGGLNGTEQGRFFNTKEGKNFKYRWDRYKRLDMGYVRKLVSTYPKYEYTTLGYL